jgi:dsDNA-binding SOS-regulon protein
MKTPGQSPERVTIIFSHMSMDHHPTSFLVLDNKELGTFWVGQANIKPGANDRAVNVYQLIDKLSSKYEEEYPHLCFEVESIACEIYKFHELEKWITDLLYQIKRKPLKLMELNELLTAGWGEGDYTTNSTIHVLRVNKTREGLRNTYKKLIGEWEAKGLRCLNTQKCKTYEDKKQDPTFLYNKARKEVLRQIKKTGKMPKDATVEKYQIKDEEIKECMGRKGIIYKITSPSGKVYVGQTIQEFNTRIKSHHRKDSGCTAISRAIQKYKDQMKYEIIEDNVLQEQLDEREIFWIKELNSLAPNGYNLNTGGQFFQITEEAKDRLRDTQNRLAIEKNGYLGTVHQNSSNTFTPVINNNTVYTFLSKGGFATKEEAIEVLKEYTKDPENFEKVEGTIQRTIGSVYKNSPNKWAASYKKEHLGHYYSKKEAEEALERYLKDPKNFVKPDKKVGSVYKRGNKWGVNYKGKYIATYDTQYEAQEALERYLRDPENFVKPRRRVGCVYKKYNKWVVLCKGNRLGSYDTQQEAENVLSMYIAQSSIYTSSSESS